MAQVKQYKCPCCGGAIVFDSAAQRMKCPYCDTEFDLEALEGFREDLEEEQGDDMRWETAPGAAWDAGETDGMRVFQCESCGGEIVADENTGASACPYCGSPVVLQGAFSGRLKPDLIIPFKLEKKAAQAAMLRHLQGKRLLPRVFREESHIEEIKGVYLPFWLFDAGAEANIRYRGTRVRAWSDSRFDYTEISHYSVLRAGHLAFRAVPVDGSSKMADVLMESIEPFDLSQAVDFNTAYLAGYLADKYDVTAEESVNRANSRIKQSTAQSFRNTVHGFATLDTEACGIRLRDGRARYALYPVWLMTTSWNGGQYIFAMNGQTGKFVGDLPEDKALARRLFLGITAAGTAAVFALQYLLWLL